MIVKIITSRQKKRETYLECPLKLFVCGIRRVKSVLLELHPTEEDTVKRIFTTFLVGLSLLKRRKKSFILGSLPKSKWTTLDDRRIFLNPDSLITSWLQTLALDFIGKEKDLRPFWNEQVEEESKKWWLPTEIDSVDLHLNSSSSSLRCTESNSLFSILKRENPQNKNLLRTSFPSSTSTPVETWEEEGIRARKIRLYPTPNQKKTLKQWMGTTRVVYNRALHHIRHQENTLIDTKKLQSLYVTKKNREGVLNETIEEWQFETPKDIRNGAIRDLKKAFKTAFTHLKRGLIRNFKMRFKRKKTYPSVEVPRTALSFKDGKLRLYPTYGLGPIKLSKREKHLSLEYDCRLQWSYGHWYLVVPYKKKSRERTPPTKNVVSLDPGVRTFYTGYSEDDVFKIQQNRERLKKLQEKLDLMRSLRDRKLIRRSSFRRRQKGLYRKVKHLIEELHYKTSQVLKDYKWILLPSFESQEMVQGQLHRKTKRELLGLQHFLFKTRLKSTLALDPYSNVIDVTEEYTSKTCGGCGKLKNIGGAEVYRCSHCRLHIDRDVNGARNILLKYLSLN